MRPSPARPWRMKTPSGRKLRVSDREQERRGLIVRKTLKNIFLVSFIIILLSCGSKMTMDAKIPDKKDRVTDYLTRLLKTKKEYPGLQYIVFNKDGILFEYSGGYADVKNKIKMTSNHTMSLFSVGKLVTAIAILQLSEDKKISLNDHLEKYIANIPYKNVTISQVLSHTGGIPNPMIGNFYIHMTEEHANFNRDKLLEETLNENKDLEFEPGKSLLYSNLGIVILGKIIEIASGKSYEDYINENIFNKLNLDQREINFLDRSRSNSAKPYFMSSSPMYNLIAWKIKGIEVEKESPYKTIRNNWYFNFPAQGGIIASSKEFSKIIADLLQENSKLLKNQEKKRFFTEHFAIDEYRIALCWFINYLDGVKYYKSQGGGLGYVAEVRLYKDNHVGTIMLINQSDHTLLDILNDIDKEFIGLN